MTISRTLGADRVSIATCEAAQAAPPTVRSAEESKSSVSSSLVLDAYLKAVEDGNPMMSGILTKDRGKQIHQMVNKKCKDKLELLLSRVGRDTRSDASTPLLTPAFFDRALLTDVTKLVINGLDARKLADYHRGSCRSARRGQGALITVGDVIRDGTNLHISVAFSRKSSRHHRDMIRYLQFCLERYEEISIPILNKQLRKKGFVAKEDGTQYNVFIHATACKSAKDRYTVATTGSNLRHILLQYQTFLSTTNGRDKTADWSNFKELVLLVKHHLDARPALEKNEDNKQSHHTIPLKKFLDYLSGPTFQGLEPSVRGTKVKAILVALPKVAWKASQTDTVMTGFGSPIDAITTRGFWKGIRDSIGWLFGRRKSEAKMLKYAKVAGPFGVVVTHVNVEALVARKMRATDKEKTTFIKAFLSESVIGEEPGSGIKKEELNRIWAIFQVMRTAYNGLDDATGVSTLWEGRPPVRPALHHKTAGDIRRQFYAKVGIARPKARDIENPPPPETKYASKS